MILCRKKMKYFVVSIKDNYSESNLHNVMNRLTSGQIHVCAHEGTH